MEGQFTLGVLRLVGITLALMPAMRPPAVVSAAPVVRVATGNAAPTAPVTSHPRLWIRPDDLPRPP